jgi:S1-C subfamily serine protease
MENNPKYKYVTWFGLFVVITIMCVLIYFRHRSHIEEVPGMANVAVGNMANSYNQIANMLDQITVSIYGGVPSQLLGSGVIIPNQQVLTNFHVVENMTDITVKVYSPAATVYKANIFQSDQQNDIAVLQVSTKKALRAAVFGNSNSLNVGDIVFSMGNSFGRGNVFAQGIVCSGNQYFSVNGMNYKNMIQIEGRVYPGASGGPLANIRGEIIGIVTAIPDPQGDFKGIGFATPINSVLAAMAGR